MWLALQEPVIEYVEGYEELEEEDDMEDFGGLAIGEDYDNGKTCDFSIHIQSGRQTLV